jgi:hypothetical protein
MKTITAKPIPSFTNHHNEERNNFTTFSFAAIRIDKELIKKLVRPIAGTFTTSLVHYLTIFVSLFIISFSAAMAQEITIDQTFSSDTVFDPFENPEAIYSLKITGGVQLLSDSSLIRVVLIDNYGNHWLVFEAYNAVNAKRIFHHTIISSYI